VGGLLSRRSFLERTALLAGAVAGAGVLADGAHARRRSNDLSHAREQTYRALVAATAVGAADAAYVDRATERFRAWYRASMPHVRAGVDATIDSVRRPRGRLDGSPATMAHAFAMARLPLAADGRCAAGVR